VSSERWDEPWVWDATARLRSTCLPSFKSAPDTVTFRPGMSAQVYVQASDAAAPWIPKTALLARRDEFCVFVETAAKRYALRKVKVGQETGDRIAIVSGIKVGDPVVVRGAILLDAEANSAL
jgi:membrane fusion protein, heavy metal efflux system